MTALDGRKVAFLVAPQGAEQVELVEPWRAVTDAGATASLVSTSAGTVRCFDHLDKADAFPVDAVVGETSADEYDALVLPGGVANPDFLRTDPLAVRFTGDFFAAGKPVAAICHAPWTLIEAHAVAGRRMTSYPSLRTDLRNAGASWVDKEVVVDDGLITSRKPADLPAFCRELVAAVGSSARTAARHG